MFFSCGFNRYQHFPKPPINTMTCLLKHNCLSLTIFLKKKNFSTSIPENEDEIPMVVSLDTKHGDTKKTGKICWGGSLEGIDCGDEVAEWLSWNLDRPGLRLIRCTSRNPPVVNNYGKLFLHSMTTSNKMLCCLKALTIDLIMARK